MHLLGHDDASFIAGAVTGFVGCLVGALAALYATLRSGR